MGHQWSSCYIPPEAVVVEGMGEVIGMRSMTQRGVAQSGVAPGWGMAEKGLAQEKVPAQWVPAQGGLAQGVAEGGLPFDGLLLADPSFDVWSLGYVTNHTTNHMSLLIAMTRPL